MSETKYRLWKIETLDKDGTSTIGYYAVTDVNAIFEFDKEILHIERIVVNAWDSEFSNSENKNKFKLFFVEYNNTIRKAFFVSDDISKCSKIMDIDNIVIDDLKYIADVTYKQSHAEIGRDLDIMSIG